VIWITYFVSKFEYSILQSWIPLYLPWSCRRASFVRDALMRASDRLVVTALAIVVGGALAAHGWLRWLPAAAAETAVTLLFDIPAQPLETALDVYGEQSRTQVLYESTLAAGRRSTAVKGNYPPAAALYVLLQGTGLDFDYTAERAITLLPSTIPALGAVAEARRREYIARFDRFLGGVQAGVMTALCHHPEARPGDFEVAIRFSINNTGTVINPSLIASTGSPSRDRAILAILARLAFSEAPPAGMPQPIAMKLTQLASSRDRNVCGEAAPG
jgi:TonB family protein